MRYRAWLTTDVRRRTERLTDWCLNVKTSEVKRATVYLDEDLHKALKLRAIESESTLSEIVNQAVRYTLEEDLDDLIDIESRKKEGSVTYEAFLKELKNRGQI